MVKSSKNIVICSAFGAIQVILMLCAKYLEFATLSFYVLCALALMMPLKQKLYKESILTYCAVSILSFLLVGIPECFVYLFICGGFTLLSVLFYDKKIPLIISIPVKIVIANLILLFFYFLFSSFIAIDLTNINLHIGEIKLYHYAILATAIALIYDFFMIYLYKHLQNWSDKIFNR